MPRKRRGVLPPEEKRLWAKVAESITPLPGREPLEPPPPVEEKTATANPAAPPLPLPPKPRPKTIPPLAPIEQKLKRALRRGAEQVDARLDLHGLRQDAAHNRLIGFLRDSQSRGARVVLVITGKGGAPSIDETPRGVLRRMVPEWLSAPEMRNIILGFEEAPPHQGGSGALYVRLRRKA